MTPYATAAERVRALYRIPTAPLRNRTLEICAGRDPLLANWRWPGEGHVCCVVGASALPDGAGTTLIATGLDAPVPFAAQSFDLVILHRTLDDLAAAAGRNRFDAQSFLTQVAGVLTPGGLVAGCVQNRASLPGIAHWAAQALRMRASGGTSFRFSLQGLRGMLSRASLADIRTFRLLPDGDAPLKLVDVDPTVTRFAFRRELDARRRHLSSMAFSARRLAVEVGLYRYLEPSIFFWAYKPC